MVSQMETFNSRASRSQGRRLAALVLRKDVDP